MKIKVSVTPNNRTFEPGDVAIDARGNPWLRCYSNDSAHIARQHWQRIGTNNWDSCDDLADYRHLKPGETVLLTGE